MKKFSLIMLSIALFSLVACNGGSKEEKGSNKEEKGQEKTTDIMKEKVEEYAEFTLTADISHLSAGQKEMLTYLYKAAHLMNDIYWVQAYGDKNKLMQSITNPFEKEFVKINYGPWDRLGNNEPFVKGVGPKPAGANFYPTDLTDAEKVQIEATPELSSQYTMVRRDKAGKLVAIPYHEFFAKEIEQAAEYLRKASTFAEDAGFKEYLQLRADALLSDEFYKSDVAWMKMKNNVVDFVVGPIENYEDQLFGYKTANESFILIKDMEWSARLNKYASLLPELQKALPCEAKYKNETPGLGSDLGAYEVVYYQGDCNAGSKTIAINLPNDERVRNDEGSRKLQLKNAMQAKFDKILMPIAKELIDKDQVKYVKFNAFFENTMFHEVAHGLGMGTVCDGSKTVREALKDTYTSLEEGKADIVGLWCVTKLNEMGEFKDKDLMDNFVTFFAGIFRSVRFGVASSHGKANMMRFYYFEEKGAFVRDEATGTYKVDFEKMQQAMLDLSAQILKIQGDADYTTAKTMIEEKGFIRPALQKDLDRLSKAGIPKDIRFIQGPKELGL